MGSEHMSEIRTVLSKSYRERRDSGNPRSFMTMAYGCQATSLRD